MSISKLEHMIRDAETAGMEVNREGDGRTVIVTARHRRTGRALDGLVIYDSGVAVRLGVDLTIATGIRKISEMRGVLKIKTNVPAASADK